MPNDKRDPDVELLLNHFVDIRQTLVRQAVAAAADFESLHWDDESSLESIDAHVSAVAELVQSLSRSSRSADAELTDAAGWQLVRSLKPLKLYVDSFDADTCPQLGNAHKWFKNFWSAYTHFNKRYGKFNLIKDATRGWRVTQKLATVFCDFSAAQLERALCEHFTNGYAPLGISSISRSATPQEWLERAEEVFASTAQLSKKLVINTAKLPVTLVKETASLTGKLLRLKSDGSDDEGSEDGVEESAPPEDFDERQLERTVEGWLQVLKAAVSFETELLGCKELRGKTACSVTSARDCCTTKSCYEVGKISSLLMMYHQWYIICEHQRMEALVKDITAVPQVFDTVTAGVFDGSAVLFDEIRRIMQRVRLMCPRNPEQCQEILAKMYVDVFAGAVHSYGAMLGECVEVVNIQDGGRGQGALRAGMAVVRTADYCLELAPQLEEALQDTQNEALQNALTTQCVHTVPLFAYLSGRRFILIKHQASIKTVELAITGVGQ